jgi:DNA-binding response OmpR family regulator
MRILVVEDEKKVASFLKKGLEEENYAVDVAHDGEEGLALAHINEYDLVILDIMLPKLDGMEVLRQIRSDGSGVPILILTGRMTT